MKLDPKNLRLILTGLLALICIGFFVAAASGLSILHKKSDQLIDLKIKNQKAETLLINLEKSKKEVAKYAYFKKVAATVIPNDKNEAGAIVDLNKMASQAGISLLSITFPDSDLARSTAKTSAISQAKPVSGAQGLYSLELTVNPWADSNTPPAYQISYQKMLNFLQLIENNRRTAEISNISIVPGSGNNQFNFNLKINIFVKP